MRLIEFRTEMLLAVDKRLVRISSPQLADVLLERVLLVAAPGTGEAGVPIEDVRTYARSGDTVTIEVFSDAAARPPVVVGPFFPEVMVNLVRGFYPDRWTAETFFAEVVNGHVGPSRVQMDFFLPALDLGESEYKTLSVSADGTADAVELERGSVRSLSFDVQETVLLSFSVEPEPARPPDLRSRGCVLAGVQGDQERQVNLFDYRHYFG
ncbi:MAG: hypothetical protein ACT4OK_02975 [Gemmobacter sp.]